MKKLMAFLSSMSLTITLLVFLAASIGYATFTENNQGTEAAKNLVYNAKWLEILYILLIINQLMESKLRSKMSCLYPMPSKQLCPTNKVIQPSRCLYSTRKATEWMGS